MPSTLSDTEPGINTYVLLAACNTYLDDSPRATEWAFLDDDTKNRCLLTAFRLVERGSYSGAPTSSSQEARFPRSGLTDRDGNTVASDSVPQEVKDAQCEFAYELSQDVELETQVSTFDNTRRVKAGSVELENFKPVRGTRYPKTVHELLQPFLSGDGAAIPLASGTDETSSFGEVPEVGGIGYP